MQRYTMVASNVPGPAAPVYVCGQKVEGLQVFYPNLLRTYYGYPCTMAILTTAALTMATLTMATLTLATLTMAGLLPEPHHADDLRIVQ
eukprot:scaffold101541_cov18-Phaeocystis_antarctica.AAC.1